MREDRFSFQHLFSIFSFLVFRLCCFYLLAQLLLYGRRRRAGGVWSLRSSIRLRFRDSLGHLKSWDTCLLGRAIWGRWDTWDSLFWDSWDSLFWDTKKAARRGLLL